MPRTLQKTSAFHYIRLKKISERIALAEKKKKQGTEKTTAGEGHNVGREIWGLVFLALGMLVLTSLISYFVQRGDNILGPLGKYLAEGLVYIFGNTPSFFFPLSIFILGWSQIKGSGFNARILGYASLFTLEICVLLAIPAIPVTSFRSNLIGKATVYLVYTPRIFGTHWFGPYFLTGIAIIITVLAAFRINIYPLLIKTGTFLKQHAFRLVNTLKSRPQNILSNAQTAPSGGPETARNNADASATKSKPNEPQKEEAADQAAQQRLDEELAEFRAKKNEPFQITTGESPPDSAHENGAGSEEPDAELEETTYSDEELSETAEPEVNLGDDEQSTGEIDEDSLEDVPDGYFKVPAKEKSPPRKTSKPYEIPSPDVLSDPPQYSSFIDREAIEGNSHTLEKTLNNFGIEGKVVNVSPGPVITRYEMALAPGIKVSKIVNLQDDIAMAVGGQKIRIQAPIPGKAAIGIELPNTNRQTVYFKHILSSDAFRNARAKLPLIVGRNISGNPFVTDITKMPHLLIAGQTGSGKSVCINSFLCSLLMTKKPEELRMILIDPKKVELSYYSGIPHLLAPVVTESKEAVKALHWGQIEMDRRYRMLAKVGARNIESFNSKVSGGKIKEDAIPGWDNKPLPFIVIVVDELADLMITASKDVEANIQRIAQLARAVGIHLIIATQRPSVDIITGPIKANLTSRIAFRTIQATDSRTILGHIGSEKLLGLGDMLFLRSGAPDIERYHGAFISEEDVESIVAAIKQQGVEIERIESFEEATGGSSNQNEGCGDDEERDELFQDAAEMVVTMGQGSTSMLQRRMKIGYARAGRLMDELERAGIVGPSEGSKVREVLIKPQELSEHLAGI
ncbi:MAG: hypothetical protein GF350_16360 [Chitinivibrionales bacterium]|nr:hypothetical protein [Chitinivibrionales bacterium]